MRDHLLIQFLLIIGWLAMGCSSPAGNTVAGSNTITSEIPSGAQIQPFEDSPGISKIQTVDESGNPTQLGTLKNGVREGNWVNYHPNGMVKSITPYVDGKIEGMQVEISTSGQVEKQIMFHNNLPHGLYKEYKYTVLKEERTYANGKLEGLAKLYYDDGKIMEEGAYKEGIRDGVSKWYDQQGKVTIEYEYKNGQLVRK